MMFVEWINILLTQNVEFVIFLLVIHCLCDKTTTVKCYTEEFIVDFKPKESP